MMCMAEGCPAPATHPIRPEGTPVVCERHVFGALGWVQARKERVEAAARPIFARLVTDEDRVSGKLPVRIATIADVAIDEATAFLDRLDQRFA